MCKAVRLSHAIFVKSEVSMLFCCFSKMNVMDHATATHVQNDQDNTFVSVHKNGSLIETFVSKNSNIHPSQPQVTQLN